MPGRQYHSGGPYRYGFNGKENDIETTSSSGGTQDYGLRIYNPALGRFLSVDPLAPEFAWNSTYAFAENDVIRCIDLEGAEKYVRISAYKHTNDDKPATKVYKWSELFPGQEHGPMGTIGTLNASYFSSVKKVYFSGMDVSAGDVVQDTYEKVSKSVVTALEDADGFVNREVKGDPYSDYNGKPHSFEAGARVSASVDKIFQGKAEFKLTARSENEITPEVVTEGGLGVGADFSKAKKLPFNGDIFMRTNFTESRSSDFNLSLRIPLPGKLYFETNISLDASKGLSSRIQSVEFGASTSNASVGFSTPPAAAASSRSGSKTILD